MRVPFMSIIVLTAMVMTLSTPSPAAAWSNLVVFLAQQACTGQSAAYKNGCYAYLEPRVLSTQSPDSSQTKCTVRCDSWYSTNPANSTACKQGCQFIRSKE